MGNNDSIIIYLMWCKDKEEKDYSSGIYTYEEVYIDFRTEKDLERYNSFTHQNLKDKTIILIKNITTFQLHEQQYYRINIEELEHGEITNDLIDNFKLIGHIYDFSESSSLNLPPLFRNPINQSELNNEEITFKNQADKNWNHDVYKRTLFKLRVNDVGQGNCNEIIINGDNTKIIYDMGATAFPIKKEEKQWEELKNKRIEQYKESHPLLIISHWHLDHYCQLTIMTSEELSCFSGLICNAKMPSLTSQHIYKKLEEAITKKKIESLETDLTKSNDGRMFLYHSTYYYNIYYGKESKNLNFSGITLFIHGEKRNVLLTGDCNYVQVSYILNQEENKIKTKKLILAVPHHGGTFTNGNNELTIPDKMKPYKAIISVGKDNKYKHPKKSILDMLEKKSFEIERTDEQGDIIHDL